MKNPIIQKQEKSFIGRTFYIIAEHLGEEFCLLEGVITGEIGEYFIGNCISKNKNHSREEFEKKCLKSEVRFYNL